MRISDQGIGDTRKRWGVRTKFRLPAIIAIAMAATAAAAVTSASPASALPRSCSGYEAALYQANWNYDSWYATTFSFAEPSNMHEYYNENGDFQVDVTYWDTPAQNEITTVGLTATMYNSKLGGFTDSLNDAQHGVDLAESALEACETGFN